MDKSYPKGLNWRKSSFSFANGDCLEVAKVPGGGVLLRDSDEPQVVIRLTTGQWGAFLNGVRHGEFDI